MGEQLTKSDVQKIKEEIEYRKLVVRKRELEAVKELLKEEMEQAASLKVPLVVDMHTGADWYEAK